MCLNAATHKKNELAVPALGAQANNMNAGITRRRGYLFALLLASAGSALGAWELPADLESRLDGLTDAQADFVTSGAAVAFLPGRQLEHEIASRDTADLGRLLDDLMALAGQMAYDPVRDMGATPLNTASRRFNRNTLPTPEPLREPERAAGPFSVHRYLHPQSGVPTFAGAKVALWPEDLVAGDVDVAIVGIPHNASSGRRDASAGPNEMRALNTIAAPDDQSLVRPHDVLSIVDYGDFSIDWLSAELTVRHVTDMVAQTAETGVIPMLVGGDTSMLYPGVKGVASVHGERTFGLLQFNAHPDSERHGDHTISDRQAIFALLDEGIVDGDATIQFGLRGPDLDQETLEWLRDRKVRYHTLAGMRRQGTDKAVAQVLREVARGPDSFFVAVDVSVIDPRDMIAAGRVVPDGLAVDDLTRAIRHVCATKDIVGFEITDLAPMLDLSRQSVLNANAVLNACLVGIAVKRAGLDADYIHPLVRDHGR